MDVSTALPGTKPYLSSRTPLPGRAHLHGRVTASAATATGGGGPGEIGGVPDGPDLVLPSGVRIRRMRIGALRVGALQVQQAIDAVRLLPLADQQLVARLGLPVELVPVTQLEQLPGTTAPVVGATRVGSSLGGRERPDRIRIAAFQSQLRSSLREAVQHEIGHVIAVATQQDSSEATAIRYAATY